MSWISDYDIGKIRHSYLILVKWFYENFNVLTFKKENFNKVNYSDFWQTVIWRSDPVVKVDQSLIRLGRNTNIC